MVNFKEWKKAALLKTPEERKADADRLIYYEEKTFENMVYHYANFLRHVCKNGVVGKGQQHTPGNKVLRKLRDVGIIKKTTKDGIPNNRGRWITVSDRALQILEPHRGN